VSQPQADIKATIAECRLLPLGVPDFEEDLSVTFYWFFGSEMALKIMRLDYQIVAAALALLLDAQGRAVVG